MTLAEQIKNEPFTINIAYMEFGDVKVWTGTFAEKEQALRMAQSEATEKQTVHVTVTDERTGAELFDCSGPNY